MCSRQCDENTKSNSSCTYLVMSLASPFSLSNRYASGVTGSGPHPISIPFPARIDISNSPQSFRVFVASFIFEYDSLGIKCGGQRAHFYRQVYEDLLPSLHRVSNVSTPCAPQAPAIRSGAKRGSLSSFSVSWISSTLTEAVPRLPTTM